MQEDNHSESAVELRVRQLRKYMTLAVVGLLILGVLQMFYTASIKQNEDKAVTNAQVQAQTTKDSTICQVYPNDELCVMAREIAANPKEAIAATEVTNGTNGKDGKNGKDGQTGRGVESFNISSAGNLEVTYTDGVMQIIGKVVGKDGSAGLNGINGLDGKDGSDGRGILSTSIDAGSLIVRYTDGTQENLGIVVGPAGQNGANGTNGIDGAPGATGAAGANGQDGQQGPPGEPGISVINVEVGSDGTVVVYYSNNTSAIAGSVIVNSITSMTCNQDTNVLTVTVADGTAFTATVDCTPEAALPIPPASNPTAPPAASTATIK